MAEERKISSLIVALVVVLALFGFIYSMNYDTYMKTQTLTESGESSLIVITEEVEKKDTRILVNDRFVGKLDEDSSIISVGNNKIYEVKKGTVLVNERVIEISDDSHSVYDTVNPEKSIYN